MTTALVLLGLAAAAGAAVFVLSARAPAEPVEGADEAPDPTTPTETARRMARMGARARDRARAATPSGGRRAPAGAQEVEPGSGSPYILGRPLRLGAGSLNWKTRLIGVGGLVVLVTITAAAVAGGLWMLAHVIGHLIGHFFTSSGGQ